MSTPRPLPLPTCHPESYRFEIPFSIAGKKSCFIAIGHGKLTRIVPKDTIVRVEDCIRLLVAADVAFARGQITEERKHEIHEMAHRRRLHEGVGKQAVRRWWEREWMGYLPGFGEELDVAIEVEVVVGLTEETDRVVITGRPEAVVGKRRRNGRRRDLDGSLATIMDGLKRSLLHDDRQASRITIWKSFEQPFPKQKRTKT